MASVTSYNSDAIDDKLSDKVSKTENETIEGHKSFAEIPLLPEESPTLPSHAASKQYVDENTGGWDPAEANPVVIGVDAEANTAFGAHDAVAIGKGAVATNGSSDSVAIGSDANTTTGGSGAVAIGHGAVAEQGATVAIGKNSHAPSASVAIGEDAGPAGFATNYVAVGSGASAGINGVSLGHNAEAGESASSSVVIGKQANAEASNSTVIGTNAKVQDASGINVAIGYDAVVEATSSNGLAIGPGSRTRNGGGIAIGQSAVADGSNSVAIGTFSAESGTGAVALGNAKALSDHSVAVGSAIASGMSGVSVGNSSQAEGEQSVAIGQNASAYHDYSMALGSSAVTTAENQTVISADELVVSPITDESPSTLVLHDPAGDPVSIGIDAAGHLYPSPPSGGYDPNEESVVIGEDARAGTNNAVSIGRRANNNGGGVSNQTVAVGANTRAEEYSSIAIGYGAAVRSGSGNAVAIGASTLVGVNHTNAIVIGNGASSKGPNTSLIRTKSLEVDSSSGDSVLILRSPDRTRWAISVDDSGAISATAL